MQDPLQLSLDLYPFHEDPEAWLDQVISEAQAKPGPHEHDWDSHFGRCPECPLGTTHEYRNIERHHYFFCDTHRTKWCVGWNLFSSWQHETEEDWERNFDHIGDYRDVESISTCTICGVIAGEETDGAGTNPAPRLE